MRASQGYKYIARFNLILISQLFQIARIDPLGSIQIQKTNANVCDFYNRNSLARKLGALKGKTRYHLGYVA